MTHHQNLESIFECGNLQSYNRMRGRTYFNLSNEDVQKGRAGIRIKETDRPLHDYVPLYFGFKTPMVARNQDQNDNLLFLRFSLDILSLQGVVISDGNARSIDTQFKVFKTIDDLAVIDSKAIQTVKYAHDLDLKRKKQAEVLVPDSLPIDHLLDPGYYLLF